jgi:uncharacterized protein YfaQ (DUF2300 family)
VRRSRFAEAGVAAALSLALAQAHAAPIAGAPAVAWLRDARIEAHGVTAAEPLPLGSLWKLFVFSYLASTHATEPAYACTPDRAHDAEERYCCHGEERIDRATALARSCAPYFAFDRLGITATRWSAHWKPLGAPAWLLDAKHVGPDTRVPLEELLRSLALIDASARGEARAALLATSLEGYGREAWTQLGTGVRYKTYSWHLDDGRNYGGAAGWLADGTPFWAGAEGSSRSVLAQWGAQVAAALPAPRTRGLSEDTCVDVDFFARYPLRAVWRVEAQATNARAPFGELRGRYRVEFANGQWLAIESRGELTLVERDGAPAIVGRVGLNEYVARVVDREGAGRPAAAARALAIAARSYLVQNAAFEAGCWHIADASRTQRVLAHPPSDAALDAAWFGDGLVLEGAPVQYHRDAAAPGRLAWRDAVARANEGWSFERILEQAYPHATLAALSGEQECRRLDEAERWLTRAASAWQRVLAREPGFEALESAPRVCALAEGRPYSDSQRLRIYVRDWRSLDERVTLAHEYLHLVLRFHPDGADEAHVERLARRLVGS